MKKWFYERNDEFINSDVNKTFEEVLWMSDSHFKVWVSDMRKEVIRIWDDLGIPPRMGINEKEIIQQFNKMRSYPVHHKIDGLECIDKETGENDCIRNTSILGTAVNQWFPTMYATKINYSEKITDGLSIYDHFKEPSLLPKMITYARRHFKRDSFYHYSHLIKKFKSGNDINEYIKKYFLEPKNSGLEWIREYESNRKLYENDFDYWLDPKESNLEYSGYNKELLTSKDLILSKKEYEEIKNIIPDKCKTNLSYRDGEIFTIRVFKRGQKIFPLGLKAFRISVCQYAVNFPPLTAKYLYEKYTEECKHNDKIVIYDPSSGWGGRLLGAMSVENDVRKIHYIGTDPNTDHNTENGRTKYHEIADFYNKNTDSIFLTNPQHTYEIYQHGSEVIKFDKNFQKHKGKVNLIFTSPPYFAKEVYSNDKEQSCIKYNEYDLWVNEFLKPTLETCVEWLAPNGYILWNIADVKFGKNILPLEKVSCEILESLGMKFEKKLKMALSQMPGGNRLDSNGKPSTKNFCRINSSSNKLFSNSMENTKKRTKHKDMWFKYEPIFVYKKV